MQPMRKSIKRGKVTWERRSWTASVWVSMLKFSVCVEEFTSSVFQIGIITVETGGLNRPRRERLHRYRSVLRRYRWNAVRNRQRGSTDYHSRRALSGELWQMEFAEHQQQYWLLWLPGELNSPHKRHYANHRSRHAWTGPCQLNRSLLFVTTSTSLSTATKRQNDGNGSTVSLGVYMTLQYNENTLNEFSQAVYQERKWT